VPPDEESNPEDDRQDLSLAWIVAQKRLQRFNIELAHCEEMIELLDEQTLMKRRGDNGQAYRHPGRV